MLSKSNGRTCAQFRWWFVIPQFGVGRQWTPFFFGEKMERYNIENTQHRARVQAPAQAPALANIGFNMFQHPEYKGDVLSGNVEERVEIRRPQTTG